MLSLLAEQLPTPSDPSQLKDFLQYGQMGLALATLIVGAGLFMTAIKQQNLSETTGGILRFFAKVMVVLFVVSFLGEMAKLGMDFYMRVHPADPQVNVTIQMPPLNAKNYKDYGPVEIKTIESFGSNQPTRVPANEPQKVFSLASAKIILIMSVILWTIWSGDFEVSYFSPEIWFLATLTLTSAPKLCVIMRTRISSVERLSLPCAINLMALHVRSIGKSLRAAMDSPIIAFRH
jgi:hypothetical protein